MRVAESNGSPPRDTRTSTDARAIRPDVLLADRDRIAARERRRPLEMASAASSWRSATTTPNDDDRGREADRNAYAREPLLHYTLSATAPCRAAF